jgi:hypothetical protein
LPFKCIFFQKNLEGINLLFYFAPILGCLLYN